MTTTTTKTMRLKVLKPVFETLTIREEELPEYLVNQRRLQCAEDIYRLFKHLMAIPRETLMCIHVDNKHKIIAVDQVSQGSLTASIVHPAQVFAPALLSGCAGIAICHQHPSGDPEPSREDIEITKRLRECAELLGLRFLDSVIIGENRYVSLADRGIIG